MAPNISEVRFYHLTRSTLEQALPPLLEKVVERGWRAVVRTSSSERAESLSETLWAYREDGFLPHGTARDGRAAVQPIWITDKDENPNTANTLILTDGVLKSDLTADLICLIFDDSDPHLMAATRAEWGAYKAAGHALTYWQQSDKGWEKKQT